MERQRSYNFFKLEYEGEYFKGVRSGKGKEYDKGILIYEGEFLHGKRNGKGKEYKNSELIFEGEFKDGKRWNGIEKEYNNYGKIKFEYEYLDGNICYENTKEYYENGK